MKRISILLFSSIVLISISCTYHHKAIIEVTFYNGDKDTISAQWDSDLILSRGDLGSEQWGRTAIASNVRTYKILNK